MKLRWWDDNEIDILKKQYPSTGTNISALADRSKRAIQGKSRRLGLCVSREAKKTIYRHQLSEDSKKRVSDGLKKYYSLYGSHRKGKKFSEASKKKLSQSLKGLLVGERNGMFGKESPYLSGGVKWHIYNSKKHGEIKLHGTYELRFAKYLDWIKADWYAHGQFERFVFYDNGVKRTYSPDFYVKDWDTYIDTKGWFTEKDQRKIELVKKFNPNKTLIIATKDILELFINNKQGDM